LNNKYNTLRETKEKDDNKNKNELNGLFEKLRILESKYNQMIPKHESVLKDRDTTIVDMKNKYRVLEGNLTGKDKEINILKSNIGSWENKAKQLQIELDKKHELNLMHFKKIIKF